ncbi:hypothetical protein F442_13597 [Phytophthora nicotianae P10297]|uniref:Uncharacterized protein n=3 Tax=Phytophthora nicotianae TaxID=4792 RepID=W2YY54_PHYNI|nr:hypothetical protein L916_13287 [Phytophthora nicotianae]ETM41000.1 hypothetical protein L914_13196 [Phytophthora nicotianae]ETO69657.1 hypothetical protein F444_13804 [Phytophthora nicotianae P1976]ETP38894.1 hypothetical protein F442_13597 [Phytophthora nicotianae P10297]
MDLQASPPAWRASFCACKTSLLQHRVVAPYCNKDSRSRCARVQFPVFIGDDGHCHLQIEGRNDPHAIANMVSTGA